MTAAAARKQHPLDRRRKAAQRGGREGSVIIIIIIINVVVGPHRAYDDIRAAAGAAGDESAHTKSANKLAHFWREDSTSST